MKLAEVMSELFRLFGGVYTSNIIVEGRTHYFQADFPGGFLGVKSVISEGLEAFNENLEVVELFGEVLDKSATSLENFVEISKEGGRPYVVEPRVSLPDWKPTVSENSKLLAYEADSFIQGIVSEVVASVRFGKNKWACKYMTNMAKSVFLEVSGETPTVNFVSLSCHMERIYIRAKNPSKKYFVAAIHALENFWHDYEEISDVIGRFPEVTRTLPSWKGEVINTGLKKAKGGNFNVFRVGRKWAFADETYENAYGPYASKESAEKARRHRGITV